jgi:hypothetical protein
LTTNCAIFPDEHNESVGTILGIHLLGDTSRVLALIIGQLRSTVPASKASFVSASLNSKKKACRGRIRRRDIVIFGTDGTIEENRRTHPSALDAVLQMCKFAIKGH